LVQRKKSGRSNTAPAATDSASRNHEIADIKPSSRAEGPFIVVTTTTTAAGADGTAARGSCAAASVAAAWPLTTTGRIVTCGGILPAQFSAVLLRFVVLAVIAIAQFVVVTALVAIALFSVVLALIAIILCAVILFFIASSRRDLVARFIERRRDVAGRRGRDGGLDIRRRAKLTLFLKAGNRQCGGPPDHAGQLGVRRLDDRDDGVDLGGIGRKDSSELFFGCP
jgi:hypothetical protein